jgi:hypothetical protein
MKTLAKQIERELEKEIAEIGHCAIYEPDLQRIWRASIADVKMQRPSNSPTQDNFFSALVSRRRGASANLRIPKKKPDRFQDQNRLNHLGLWEYRPSFNSKSAERAFSTQFAKYNLTSVYSRKQRNRRNHYDQSKLESS